ncbi:MAG: bifunctional molybdenum cofactor biosynthesis protein MoaAD [Puniceicoccaceae bacterium 5H]|nr:MAG: bifunctional molybdenum cofactor biosynthesis protein MoaAD [Puniceicoccaceae bacterium 5H]
MKRYALVLAGGRSRRMGRDKATLRRPDGRTQLQHTLDLARRFSDRAYLSRRSLPAEPPPAPVVVDRWPGQGPLGAILSAQLTQPHAEWLVLACDLPLLDARTLERLLAGASPEDAAVAFRSAFDGKPEPLCALYRPALRPALQRAWAYDVRCPRKVLTATGVRLLALPSPCALDNANTPADWQASFPSQRHEAA